MKKRFLCLLSLLLALSLLSGCAPFSPPGGLQAAFGRASAAWKEPAPPFEQIAYERPSVDELREALEELKEALNGGGSLGSVTRFLDGCYESYYHFYTMYCLADIRYCQDTTNSFYAEEYAWCEENFSLMQRLMEELYYACALSGLGESLERDYFWEGFLEEYADPENSRLNDRTVALMQRESALLAQYRELTAAPTIRRNGREVDFYTYLSGLTDPEEYEAARMAYYEKYNGPLAELYIALAGVRRELAGAMGYESYEAMQYDYTFQRDYGPEEAAAYLAGIREHIVPLYREAQERGAFGQVWYGELGEARLHGILGAGAEVLGGDVLDAYRFMSEGGYYDIRVSPLKASMSFETYLTDYEAPFLFLDAYGDTEDILSYSHEFGHYVDAYVNADAYETIDVSECFSQSMEVLMLSCCGGVLDGEKIENLRRMKLLDMLDLYVQQASFAEFESRVYAAAPEELSADFLNSLSLELAKDYGYYDGVSEEFYAMSWVDIVHFFEYPFYVISYPVSNDAAVQIYALEQEAAGQGKAAYLRLLDRGDAALTELLESKGLQSPFAPGRLEAAAALLRRELLGK